MHADTSPRPVASFMKWPAGLFASSFGTGSKLTLPCIKAEPEFALPVLSAGISKRLTRTFRNGEKTMDGIIYLVGLVVIVLAILSLLGLR